MKKYWLPEQRTKGTLGYRLCKDTVGIMLALVGPCAARRNYPNFGGSENRDLVDLDRKTCSQKEGVTEKLVFLRVDDGRGLIVLFRRRKVDPGRNCVGLVFF